MALSLENQDVMTLPTFSRENVNRLATACGNLSLSIADHVRLMRFGMVFVRTQNKYTQYEYRSKRRDYWGDGREWISFHSRSEDDGGVVVYHSILDTGELVGGMKSRNLVSFSPSWGWPCVHEDYQGETWTS